MSDFLAAEASYLAATDGIEPIIEDVKGDSYRCEGKNCERSAAYKLSWPMEDHDLQSGFFCDLCLEVVLNNPEVSE